MAKVFLDEMTWREAKEAIQRGAPVFLPTGPVEGHGPHVPLGCDYYIATNFSGATSTFPGAVSVPMEVQIEGLDPELGVQALREGVEKMLPVVEALREYVQWLEGHPRRFIE